MALKVRAADLQGDREEMIGLLQRNLTPQFSERRFRQFYLDGPHGQGSAWLVYDEAGGRAIGCAAAFPRRLYVDGQALSACVFGDFCIEEGYRSLGPAVLLQRACLEDTKAHGFEFCYDFPSQSMMAVYSRLRVRQTTSLWRWAKPLRVENKLQPFTRSKLVAKGLSAAINAGLELSDKYRAPAGDCDLALHEGPCREEFSRLDAEVSKEPAVKTVRTAEYLNWRYFGEPERKYEFMTARRRGTLIGYAVFLQEEPHGSIVDLCSLDEPPVVQALLSGVVELFRGRGLATASLNAGDKHPWNGIFEKAGFHRREQAPVIAYSCSPSSCNGSRALHSWHVMRGDRDS